MEHNEYDYVITKPELEEVLYHAGFHKYIDKYLGKNGKWIYKYAGQAKSAANGLVSKAKAAIPGLQKQANGTITNVKKRTSSMLSSGSKAASGVATQARKRVNAMLPALLKKANSAKKKARSQAAGVKLVARDKTKKLKKQADGTFSDVKKSVKNLKNKNLYQRTKRKVGEATGKYKRDHASSFRSKQSGLSDDSRYSIPYSRVGSLKTRGYVDSRFKENYAMQLAKERKERNSAAAKRAKKNRRAK